MSGVPELQLDMSIAAFSITELSGEPTVRVPQAAPEVVRADEKVKAQALLDVVNEINYFTQKSA